MENETKEIRKEKVLSCIQPTGIPTIGNYFGALKNWKKMSEDFDCAFAVADLHAITVRQDRAKFKNQILDMFALLLALGLDPQKNIVFVQSQVPAHSQLAWILSCYTAFGEMSRMTQFKDKSQKHPDNINVGLFTYPVLMAADILLYNADYVPVGKDQTQHLEIARDIAGRFNAQNGQTFVLPKPYITKEGASIKSLTEPTKKMSKSDPNQKSFVSLFDEPNVIMKKIKSAVTDSDGRVMRGENKDGIENLMSIYSCCTGLSFEQIEDEFRSKGYGEFKTAVGEALCAELAPVQEAFKTYRADKGELLRLMELGKTRAEMIANRTLSKAMKKVGFV